MTKEWCLTCGGEGKLYTSRYGGNDPDVWPTGPCEACDGTGWQERPCAKCEYFDIGLMGPDGESDCLNSKSPRFQTGKAETCNYWEPSST